jgi:hypothetical protein
MRMRRRIARVATAAVLAASGIVGALAAPDLLYEIEWFGTYDHGALTQMGYFRIHRVTYEVEVREWRVETGTLQRRVWGSSFVEFDECGTVVSGSADPDEFRSTMKRYWHAPWVQEAVSPAEWADDYEIHRAPWNRYIFDLPPQDR